MGYFEFHFAHAHACPTIVHPNWKDTIRFGVVIQSSQHHPTFIMPPTLHHVPRTISSPIVQCLLELDLVDKPIVIVEKGFADLKTAAHLAVNPMGTSPAFQDDGIILWESGAVLDYLLERYDSVHYKLHPPPIVGSSTSADDIAKRAKYLHLKQYSIATVYPFVASLAVHKLSKSTQEQDDDYVASSTNKITTLLLPTLTQWLGDGPFFLGSKMSAVDILVAKPLNNLHQLGLLQQNSPTLFALLEKVRSLPSFDQAYTHVATAHDANHDEGRDLVLVPGNKKTGAETKTN